MATTRTIFFVYPAGTQKLANTTSDKEISELISDGVIPSGSKYLEVPVYSESMALDDQAKYSYVEHCSFDSYTTPTKIVVDFPSIMIHIKNDLREFRKRSFSALDTMQQRALVKNDTALVNEIDADKVIIRDCINNIDSAKYTKADDFKDFVPDVLRVDYITKYKSRF